MHKSVDKDYKNGERQLFATIERTFAKPAENLRHSVDASNRSKIKPTTTPFGKRKSTKGSLKSNAGSSKFEQYLGQKMNVQ